MVRHTGNLRRTPFGVVFTASPWVALWGGVQLAVFGLLFVALLGAAWPSVKSGSAMALRPVLAMLALFGFCYTLYWFYVKPWLLRRRKERERDRNG